MSTKPEGPCSVEGCGKPSVSVKHKLCPAHLARLRRYGDATASPIGTPEERFWAKVNKNGPIPAYRPDLGSCWEWTAPLHRKDAEGYGRINVNGRQILAHCFAYELLVGAVPEGLELDHLCRVTRCVNPAHLEPVTHRENMDRGVSLQTINSRKTHCDHGHEFTPENTMRRSDGGRRCRACTNRIRRERRRRLREVA